MSISGITGLAGNILNSQYNSALGNTLQQNLAGSQTQNVFGSSVWTFINLVRIFQRAKLVDEAGQTPIVDLENPLGTPEQFKSIEWKETEKSKFYQRLAYLFKFHLPILGEMKVPSPVDFGIMDGDGWNGFTRVHVGDLANLHYKGTIYDTYRACNHVKYNYGQGFDGSFNPLYFDADQEVGQINSPENQAIVESKDFFQTQLESFANTQWRIGVVVSWAFSEYSNLVSTDQAVTGNMAWEAANMAFELAQFLVLHQLGGFQEEWINEIMNKEIALGTEAKLDETQIFASIANIKSMEEQLTTEFESLLSGFESKNKLAAGALSDLITKMNTLKEEMEQSIIDSNTRLLSDYEARIAALKVNIKTSRDEGQNVEKAEFLVESMEMNLDRMKAWFKSTEDRLASTGKSKGTPSSQNNFPQINGETTTTAADEAIVSNPGANSALGISINQATLLKGVVTATSDLDMAEANTEFVVFEQQVSHLLARIESEATPSKQQPVNSKNVSSTGAKKGGWFSGWKFSKKKIIKRA